MSVYFQVDPASGAARIAREPFPRRRDHRRARGLGRARLTDSADARSRLGRGNVQVVVGDVDPAVELATHLTQLPDLAPPGCQV